jgi:hypothetical protein
MPLSDGARVGASLPNPVLLAGAGSGFFVQAVNATTTNANPSARFTTLDPPLL